MLKSKVDIAIKQHSSLFALIKLCTFIEIYVMSKMLTNQEISKIELKLCTFKMTLSSSMVVGRNL